jgi:hypothetical protein
MKRPQRQLVRERAGHRCEYCRLPLAAVPLMRFHVEHIFAKQHGVNDNPENLALACYHCNLHKGPNLSGIDPASGKIVRLFHPRRQTWHRHFRWNGPVLAGRTPTGRATIGVLAINHPDRIDMRRLLVEAGLFSVDDGGSNQ